MKFFKIRATFANCCGASCLHSPVYVYSYSNLGVRLSFQPLPELAGMRYDVVSTSEGPLYLEFPTKLVEGGIHPSYKEVPNTSWDVYFPEYAKCNVARVKWSNTRFMFPRDEKKIEQLYKEYLDLSAKLSTIAYATNIEHFTINDIIYAHSAYFGKVGVCILSDEQAAEDDNSYTEENIKERLGSRLIYQSKKFWNLGYPEKTDPYLTLFIFEKN